MKAQMFYRRSMLNYETAVIWYRCILVVRQLPVKDIQSTLKEEL